MRRNNFCNRLAEDFVQNFIYLCNAGVVICSYIVENTIFVIIFPSLRQFEVQLGLGLSRKYKFSEY